MDWTFRPVPKNSGMGTFSLFGFATIEKHHRILCVWRDGGKERQGVRAQLIQLTLIVTTCTLTWHTSKSRKVEP